jgi:hypothetical protein
MYTLPNFVHIFLAILLINVMWHTVDKILAPVRQGKLTITNCVRVLIELASFALGAIAVDFVLK